MNIIQSINSISNASNLQSIFNKKDEKQEKDPFLTDAASVLGLSYEELLSELESGSDLDTIAEEQGLTVEEFRQQMDELNPNKGQAGQAAPPPPPPPDGMGIVQFFSDAAEVLGISSEDLQTELQSGKDLQTIISEQGLSEEDFQSQMYTLLQSNQSTSVFHSGRVVDKLV